MSLTVGSTTARLGLEDRFKKEIGQLIDMDIRLENDIAPIAAITAIGASLGNEFFAAKAGGTASTISCLGMNFNPIDEHPISVSEADDKVALFSGQLQPSRKTPRRVSVRRLPSVRQAGGWP